MEDGKREAVESDLSYIPKQPDKGRRATGRLGSQGYPHDPVLNPHSNFLIAELLCAD